MSTPPLTVVIAFHNDRPFIAEAIDSVLGQTYRDFELILVNDGSTDGSRDVVAGYRDSRIRLLDNPENLRLARSLNRGVAAARGSVIARLDANDVARPDRFEKQMRFLDDHPEFALVGGQAVMIDTRGRRIHRARLSKPVTELGVQWYLLFDSPFIHSAVMFRKSAFDQVGGYDPAFDRAQDFDLWSRMAVEHRMANLRDVLVSLRYDPKSITYDVSKARAGNFLPLLEDRFTANMRRILAVDHAQEWASLVTAFLIDQGPVTEGMVRRYVEAVDAVERRFGEVHPEAERNSDVRIGKAQLLARAVFRRTPRARRSSARVYLHMLRAHGPTAWRVLPKFGAVSLLGSHAWNVWRWWRTRRGA